MPYARNQADGHRVYFEDDGGAGQPVVLHGGIVDCVDDVRESAIARALPAGEFRPVFVDHRGLGRSDKPHDPAAYAMPLRVADAEAVLDELGLERAHFVGMSWGGRLGFGIGRHAPERAASLVIGGQQPYEWPDSPLVRAVTRGLEACGHDGTKELVEAFETFWHVQLPAEVKSRWARNDPDALRAAWETAMTEGPLVDEPAVWHVRTLLVIGADDADFREQARRAAAELPGIELLLLDDADHLGTHVSRDQTLTDAALRHLRTSA